MTPVIVISALDQDVDKLTALRIGADAPRGVDLWRDALGPDGVDCLTAG